jgi:hypothetical protein
MGNTSNSSAHSITLYRPTHDIFIIGAPAPRAKADALNRGEPYGEIPAGRRASVRSRGFDAGRMGQPTSGRRFARFPARTRRGISRHAAPPGPHRAVGGGAEEERAYDRPPAGVRGAPRRSRIELTPLLSGWYSRKRRGPPSPHGSSSISRTGKNGGRWGGRNR